MLAAKVYLLELLFKDMYGKILSNEEKNIFKNLIKKLTIENLNISKYSTLKKALSDIEKLKNIQLSQKNYDISNLRKIILNCKKLGTLPFSILARHALLHLALSTSCLLLLKRAQWVNLD